MVKIDLDLHNISLNNNLKYFLVLVTIKSLRVQIKMKVIKKD